MFHSSLVFGASDAVQSARLRCQEKKKGGRMPVHAHPSSFSRNLQILRRTLVWACGYARL